MIVQWTLALALAAAPHQLKWDPRIDLPAMGVLGLTGFVGEFALKRQLAPPTCRWCATNDVDTAFRKLFNPNLSPSAAGIRPAATASDILGFVVVPVVAFGIDALGALDSADFWKTWSIDAVIMLESTLAAMTLVQVTKFAAGRARPYTIDASPDLLDQARDPSDHFLSFFSGHTTFTVGLAVSSGVVGMLRGYKWAWLGWAAALPLALATGTLRMAADKHWMTDVLVGTLVGGAFSTAIPLLFHGREKDSTSPTVRLNLTGSGLAISGSFH